ncbi:MAG: hypothetical protein ACE5EO_10065 [Candidatus Krumholzibacteriia bacterium]
MLRRLIALSLVLLFVAGVGMAGEKPWFDMENCGMCKSLGSNAELMENLSWEQHNISNGILAVTTVSPKYLESYRAAHAEMSKTAQRLAKGEMMEMCGSCMAFGMCMMKGARQEYVETSTGDVWIVTSDNPELVVDLQNWVKRNKEEMAKLKPAKG